MDDGLDDLERIRLDKTSRQAHFFSDSPASMFTQLQLARTSVAPKVWLVQVSYSKGETGSAVRGGKVSCT